MNEAKDDIAKSENFVPFGRFVVGENKLVVDTSAGVTTEKGKFGIQHLYLGQLNGEKVKINLPKSVEMRVLLGLKNRKTTFTVTKTGEGMQTRYRVK